MRYNISTLLCRYTIVLLAIIARTPHAQLLTDISSVTVKPNSIRVVQDCNWKSMFTLTPAYDGNVGSGPYPVAKRGNGIPENTLDVKVGQSFGLIEYNHGGIFKLLSIDGDEATVMETQWHSYMYSSTLPSSTERIKKVGTYAIPETVLGFKSVKSKGKKVFFQLEAPTSSVGKGLIVSSKRPKVNELAKSDTDRYTFKPILPQRFEMRKGQSFYLWGLFWPLETIKFTIVKIYPNSVLIQESIDKIISNQAAAKLRPLCTRVIKNY